MQAILFRDVQKFCDRVMPLLLEKEAENNLPVGILERGLREGAQGWFMACIADENGQDALIALMTPPFNLILTGIGGEVPEDAMQVLLEALEGAGIKIPGVLGESGLAHRFAKKYMADAHWKWDIMDERIYRLDEVMDVPCMGALRLATEEDLHFIPYWISAFGSESKGGSPLLDAEGVRDAIQREGYYLLEVGNQPVCLAGCTRQMPHGRSVGPVFTPPYFRGKGYGTSAVAQLSRLLLQQGNEYCALFTDLSNPISNSIYQKIGYRPICDYAQITFLREEKQQ